MGIRHPWHLVKDISHLPGASKSGSKSGVTARICLWADFLAVEAVLLGWVCEPGASRLTLAALEDWEAMAALPPSPYTAKWKNMVPNCLDGHDVLAIALRLRRLKINWIGGTSPTHQKLDCNLQDVVRPDTLGLIPIYSSAWRRAHSNHPLLMVKLQSKLLDWVIVHKWKFLQVPQTVTLRLQAGCCIQHQPDSRWEVSRKLRGRLQVLP